jgi:hypothetical protein
MEGSGSIPLISGSGSGSRRPKTWIRRIRNGIRIRIRNNDNKKFSFLSCLFFYYIKYSGEVATRTQQTLTFYELDLGLNHVVRWVTSHPRGLHLIPVGYISSAWVT